MSSPREFAKRVLQESFPREFPNRVLQQSSPRECPPIPLTSLSASADFVDIHIFLSLYMYISIYIHMLGLRPLPLASNIKGSSAERLKGSQDKTYLPRLSVSSRIITEVSLSCQSSLAPVVPPQRRGDKRDREHRRSQVCCTF